MILRLDQDVLQKDVEILIKYPKITKNIESIVSFIRSLDAQIECNSGRSVLKVDISDIYYIESNNKTTVVYCEKDHFKTNYRLTQLNDILQNKGFAQISKYCVVNTNKIERFKSLGNSRMEVLLPNKVRLFINRKYYAGFKRRLHDDW